MIETGKDNKSKMIFTKNVKLILFFVALPLVSPSSLVEPLSEKPTELVGQAVAGLRISIGLAALGQNPIGEPAFHVSFENVGDTDMLINLGSMLANGKVLLPDAIRLTLVDVKGVIKHLQFFDKKHGAVGGRIDDYVLPLRSDSIYILTLRFRQLSSPSTKEFGLKLAPGTYKIWIDFEGALPRYHNSDAPWLDSRLFWRAKARSNILKFKIS